MQGSGSVCIIVSVVAATVVGGVRPAAAQDTGLLPVRVKVGVFRPTSGTTRNFAGSTNFDGEVDAALPGMGGGKTLIGAGYSQGSRNGGKLRVIPITVARMFAPPNPVAGATGNVYFGVGAGPYFVKASAGGAAQSKTTLGAFGMAGYQFPGPFFVEAKYHVVGKVAGLSPGGLAIMVGRRF